MMPDPVSAHAGQFLELFRSYAATPRAYPTTEEARRFVKGLPGHMRQDPEIVAINARLSDKATRQEAVESLGGLALRIYAPTPSPGEKYRDPWSYWFFNRARYFSSRHRALLEAEVGSQRIMEVYRQDPSGPLMSRLRILNISCRPQTVFPSGRKKFRSTRIQIKSNRRLITSGGLDDVKLKEEEAFRSNLKVTMAKISFCMEIFDG